MLTITDHKNPEKQGKINDRTKKQQVSDMRDRSTSKIITRKNKCTTDHHRGK